MRTCVRTVSVLVVMLVGVLTTVAFAATVQGATEPARATSGARPTSGPWDLVYISDSSGWGVASFYARKIRQDRAVKVRIHDMWEGDLSARSILKRLRTPGDELIPLVRDAEVIVVYGNAVGLGIKPYDSGICFSVYQPFPAVRPEAWRPYVATLAAIYKRIFEIRKGKPVVLRTANWYVPVLKQWEEAGIRDACMALIKSWFAAIARAAQDYRVPMADVNRAFNGPSGLQDPVEKGYMQADGIHPNNTGRAVIAKTLAALGYRQVKPPR